MLEEFDLSQTVEPLLSWYPDHARTLPWRSDPTPYHVWVSEIMLQQTRVEAVKPYYARFMEALPDVKALAECEEEKLLKLWEGLGYYNRVRNMQEAAKTVVAEYGGSLPADYEKLRALKGIGNYTAGAISSIAYGLPYAAVDGNVLRVITRVSGDTGDIMKASVRGKIEDRLNEIMPKQAGMFNQALMELGATVCVPNGEPQCGRCPWELFCVARKEELTEQIPVKSKAKPRKIEKRTVFVIREQNHVVLHKRPNRGLLAGLYEFPNVAGMLNEEEALAWIKEQKLLPLHIEKLEEAKHIFSHVEWHMTGYAVRIDELAKDRSGMLYVGLDEVKKAYPIPTAFSAYVKYIDF